MWKHKALEQEIGLIQAQVEVCSWVSGGFQAQSS